MKQHFQLCYLITILRIFTTPTNSGCFINVDQTNPISWKQRNVQVVNTAIPGLLVWQLPVPLTINCLCLLLLKQNIQGVLKTLRNLPVDINHKKRWMDSVLLEEWVRDVNKTFQAEWREVALIIDNCPAHPIIENLSHLKLVLPPNTTSVTQPMNQSVIRCLKAHYKKRLVKLILRSLDSNKPLPKVSLLTALQLLVSAWNEVSQTTIANWFNEAKISEKDQTIAISDEDDPFKVIDKNPKEL